MIVLGAMGAARRVGTRVLDVEVEVVTGVVAAAVADAQIEESGVTAVTAVTAVIAVIAGMVAAVVAVVVAAVAVVEAGGSACRP